MKKGTWTSKNGKWAIGDVEAGKDTSMVRVRNLVNNKEESVMVEHIVKGQILILGYRAEESSDNIVCSMKIPEYVQQQIIKMVKVEKKESKEKRMKEALEMGEGKIGNLEVNINDEKKPVVTVNESTVAVMENGWARINSLRPFAKDGFDYDSIILVKQDILNLADTIRELDKLQEGEVK